MKWMAVSAAVLFALAGAAQAGTVTLYDVGNAGFESSGWSPWWLTPDQFQYGGAAEIDPTVSYSGQQSAKLYLRYGGSRVLQDVAVSESAGTEVSFGLWALMPQDGSVSNKWFVVVLTAYDHAGQMVGSSRLDQFAALPDWTHLTVSLTPSANFETIRIQLDTGSGNGGYSGFDRAVWVDDVGPLRAETVPLPAAAWMGLGLLGGLGLVRRLCAGRAES